MKRQIALVLALAAGGLTLAVAPALAGKGGGGSGGNTPSSPTVAIATINGTSAASTQNPAPKLGDSVTFATVDGSLAGWEYPMVVVALPGRQRRRDSRHELARPRPRLLVGRSS